MAFTAAAIDPGATPTLQVGVEQIGGVDYQAVKLVDGTPGSTTPVGTTANPLNTLDAAVLAELVLVLAKLNASIAVTGTFFQATQPVSGTVTTTPPANASTNIAQVAGATVAQGHGTAGTALRVELPTDGTGVVGLAAGAATIGTVNLGTLNGAATQTTLAALLTALGTPLQSGGNVAVTSSALPSGAATQTTLAALLTALGSPLQAGGNVAITGGSIGVTGTMPVKLISTTSVVTSVAGSVSSVNLLALNASRALATIFNDSTAILYVKLGATASTTSYTIQVAAGGYYEVPAGYSGNIDGIWASATGNGRISELS